MASGISNRQIASHQDVGGIREGRVPAESTAASTDENRKRISSDDTDDSDGNSASNTGNPSGATGKDGSSAAKGAPRAEQRLLSARGCLDRRGDGDRQEGAHLHGHQGPAGHQQVLVR